MEFKNQLIRKAGEPDSNKVVWTKKAMVEAMGNMHEKTVPVRAYDNQLIGNAIIHLNPESDGILADVFIDDENAKYLQACEDFHFSIGCHTDTKDVEDKDGILTVKKCKIFDVSLVGKER